MISNRVTVFGGSGFLGRQIVRRLAAGGSDVRVAVRHPKKASLTGAFARDGQIEVVRADVWDEPTVAQAVKKATWVINTVGHYVEKSSATFDAIHGRGAQNVARQAGIAGVERLIHVSGLGADPAADSPYVRARGIGEDLVKGAFEGATILRPAVIFGPDDSFFNTLASMARRSPVLPLFGGGLVNLQPVFVGDVAEACVRVLADPSTRGKTYELGGPRVYAYKTLLQLVLKQVDRRGILVPVPFFAWDILAGLLAFLPNPPLTRDQVKLMKRDNVIEGSEMTLEDLGIGPVAVEEILSTYIGPDCGAPAS
jgi:NADH dehydrogenase